MPSLFVCGLDGWAYVCAMALVTVYSTVSSADAHLDRSRLEASDLHATVNNELAALSMDGYSMATGGILVQVLTLSDAFHVWQLRHGTVAR